MRVWKGQPTILNTPNIAGVCSANNSRDLESLVCLLHSMNDERKSDVFPAHVMRKTNKEKDVYVCVCIPLLTIMALDTSLALARK